MAEATQKVTAKGYAAKKNKKTRYAIPVGRKVDLHLKQGFTVSVRLTKKDGTPAAGRTDISKISDVKDNLGKLLEIVSSGTVPSDTLDALLSELNENATRLKPRSGGLTKSQADVLVRSGAFTADGLAGMEKRIESGELAKAEYQTRLGVILRALTAEQVGERLGISTSRVRHRFQDNALYAFRSGKSRRYPLWQFVGDEVIPGLKAVIPHFIDGWHPASIEGFMTTPKEELSPGDETSMSPVDWLAGGGEADKVVSILDRIART